MMWVIACPAIVATVISAIISVVAVVPWVIPVPRRIYPRGSPVPRVVPEERIVCPM